MTLSLSAGGCMSKTTYIYVCLGQLINMNEMKLPKNFHTITHYAHPRTHMHTLAI